MLIGKAGSASLNKSRLIDTCWSRHLLVISKELISRPWQRRGAISSLHEICLRRLETAKRQDLGNVEAMTTCKQTIQSFSIGFNTTSSNLRQIPCTSLSDCCTTWSHLSHPYYNAQRLQPVQHRPTLCDTLSQHLHSNQNHQSLLML